MPYCSKCSGRASLFAPASSETKDVRFGRNQRADAGAIDAGKGAEFDRGSGDRGASMAGADDRGCITLFHKIYGAANGGVLFATNRSNGAVAHLDHLSGVNDLDPAVVAVEVLQFGLDLRGVTDEKKLMICGYSLNARTAPPTRLGGPKSPPMASRAIFIEGALCGFQSANAK